MTVKNIFVACGFTWNNKGDAALLMATAQALRKSLPEVTLSFASFTPVLDTENYHEKVVRMPLDPSGRPSKFIHSLGKFSPIVLHGVLSLVLSVFRIWLLLQKVFPEKLSYGLLGRIAPTAKEIMNADLVVALPGGYLQATVRTDDFWLFHWLTLSMAKAAGKPVVIYAQSIGPFEGSHKSWAINLLKKIDVISVREDFSLDRLKEYGLPMNRIVLVPDAAFGLEDDGRGIQEMESLAESLKYLPQPWVGVSVREHNFPGKTNPEVWMDKYITEIARAADLLIELSHGTVFFVPQCIRTGGLDLEVSREVLKKMSRPECARIIDEDISPLALQVLYARFEMLIGTRMHANILTMCAGTPVVAIAYERKTNGIMKMLGLEENVINIEDVEGALLPLVERVFSTRESIKQHLAQSVPKIRSQALATPKILIAKLQEFTL